MIQDTRYMRRLMAFQTYEDLEIYPSTHDLAIENIMYPASCILHLASGILKLNKYK